MNKIRTIVAFVRKKGASLFLCLFLPVFLVTIFSFDKVDSQVFFDKKDACSAEKETKDKKEEFVDLGVETYKSEEVDEKVQKDEALKKDEIHVLGTEEDKAEDCLCEHTKDVKSSTVISVSERYIDPTKPMVALTFDDGPNKIKTNKILDILEKHNVVATFFELGDLVKKNPETVRREESIGCEVGNHSYEHKNLDKLTDLKIREDVQKSEAIFYNVLGHKTKLFRTPYGNANDKVRKNIDYPIVKWDVDTLDWKSRNTEKVLKKLREVENYDGRIILMHSLYDSTVDAVAIIVPELIEKGYQLVTVSELAYYKGYETLENGKVYCNFR